MLTSSPPTRAPGTDKTGMDFRRILPEIRCQSCLSPGSEPTPRGGFSNLCPGNEESAGESHSTRSPKGNRHMRRLLNQAAQSAVKVKGSIFELTFSRLLPRLGYQQAIWAIAHRLC